MKTNYSEKEIRFIKYFNFYDLVEKDIADTLNPPMLYRMMVEKAFVDNITGKETDSLRKCYKALMKCTCYRMTDEWDSMIEFSDD